MKINWRKIGIIAIWTVGILLILFLLLFLFGYFRHILIPNQIERIEFYTYFSNDGNSPPEMCMRELTDDEVSTFLTIYNLSRDVGEIDAESFYRAYNIRIYFKDGSYQDVEEGINSKLNLKSSSGDIRRFLKNPNLIEYIYELAEKYNMPID